MTKRITITLFLFSVYGFLFSQVGGSLQLVVMGGSNVSYVFNSIAKYTNGITDADRTTVGIKIDDNADPAYLSWSLDIQFADPGPILGVLNGSGGNTLPFNTVEVSTTLVACAGCTELFPGPPPATLALSAVPQTLVQGGDGPLGPLDDIPPTLVAATDRVLITYYIGTTGPAPGNRLLGQPADFYSNDIILTLTMF